MVVVVTGGLGKETNRTEWTNPVTGKSGYKKTSAIAGGRDPEARARQEMEARQAKEEKLQLKEEKRIAKVSLRLSLYGSG